MADKLNKPAAINSKLKAPADMIIVSADGKTTEVWFKTKDGNTNFNTQASLYYKALKDGK